MLISMMVAIVNYTAWKNVDIFTLKPSASHQTCAYHLLHISVDLSIYKTIVIFSYMEKDSITTNFICMPTNLNFAGAEQFF